MDRGGKRENGWIGKRNWVVKENIERAGPARGMGVGGLSIMLAGDVVWMF